MSYLDDLENGRPGGHHSVKSVSHRLNTTDYGDGSYENAANMEVCHAALNISKSKS